MKKSLLLLIVSISLGIYTQAQKAKSKFDFSVIFGDCFRGDSVTVKINSILFAENLPLESNTAGSANYSIVQRKGGVMVSHYESGRFILQKIDTKLPVTIHISVKNDSLNQSFDLKKGKIIYIEYCWDKNRIRRITASQRDSPVFFL